MTLKRFPDWRDRLGLIIDSRRELAFEWGRFDCALHVCDCIRAMTGVDPAEGLRGTYSDEAGAAKIYGTNLQQYIATSAAAQGMTEVPVTFARRGDVVFIDNKTPQGAVGVVSLDPRFASCAAEIGHAMVAIEHWKRAWSVG
jgi:hypothetical protein